MQISHSLVFENRKPLLTGPVETKLKEILYQVAKEFRSQIIELEVMPDHAHILTEIDPQFGVNRLIKYMKGDHQSYCGTNFMS